ncbi:hypothetical protein IKE72_01275 [Candidatus Saccharibacteria bacterium]|nr:hypothetical protein [Candidatus Saccharibacteria bacterium]
MSGKRKYQASKSTSNKRLRRKRDILLDLPHSEFLGIASTFSGLVLSLLFGLTIYNNTHASSINITIPSGSTVLNTLNDGTFSESSVNASALVWTDNYTGYNLTIMGGNSTGVLEGTKGGTIPSIETEVTREKFASDATLMNKWGFKPSKLYKSGTTIDNSNYIKSPTSDESVIIDNTKTANDENHKNTYTLALAAKVDNTTPLDSYSQTFTLAATGNATEYHIAYVDANNNMPGITYGESTNGKAQITDVKPHKDGYVFGGWCTVAVLANQDCVAAGGTVIPANGELQLDAASANNRNLYAIWATGYDNFDAAFQNAGKDKVGSYYAMQDMTEDICRTIVIGSSGTLVDIRDNRTYAVSKYADNNCWMHQNLELTFYTGTNGEGYAGDSTTTANSVANEKTILTSDDTDITSGSSVNISDFKATQNAAPGASTGGWDDDGNDGGHSFSWVAYDPAQAYAIPTGTQNEYGQNEYTTSANGAPSQRGGNLYNWTMATLGSGKSITTDGTAAPNSICPKGWQLPVNSGNKSFYNLLDAYYTGTISPGNPQTGSTIANPSALTIQQNLMRSNPLDFVVSGVYNRSYGTIYGRTTEGPFWSGTAVSATSARHLTSHSTGFSPQHADYRGFGFAVRCVAR